MTEQLPIENEIKKSKMEVDRTYTQETIRNNHPSNHHVEPPREEEKRYATKTVGRKKETKEMGYTRKEIEKMATDRKRWRSMVDGLCSQRAKSHT